MSHTTVLDPCCGGRMMWFDRHDQRSLFGDIRSEVAELVWQRTPETEARMEREKGLA